MSSPPRERAAVRVARALGDPTRFRLLRAVAAREEVSCAELTARVRLAQATVSHHLKVLSGAGLVSVRKEGAFHYYRFNPAVVAAYGAALTAALAVPRSGARAGRGR